MKRKIVAFMLFITMFLTMYGIIAIPNLNAAKGIKIQLYYHREDENYNDWNVWMWEAGEDGNSYMFHQDDEGNMVAEAEFKTGTTQVGYIVRKGDWEEKDWEDQFINISQIITGTIQMYVESGKEGAEIIYKDDIVTGVAKRSAMGENIEQNIFSTVQFEEEFTYDGKDLGAIWSEDETIFRVWAPTAESVSVQLYKEGDRTKDDFIESLEMTKEEHGTWMAKKAGDLHKTYYTYQVIVDEEKNEACDPYAKAVGVNGDRAMVVDLSQTNPEGWEDDVNPNSGMNVTDMTIYELHIRDFSYEESSGMAHKGKYLSFTETNTTNSSGQPTGVDYLSDLGITHLHLLPAYDYGSVDETKLDTDQFNWGYDPKNYNVPEGSYATDPYQGEVRILEFKQMVQSLHNRGISVVMDVVYNHTHDTNFSYNKIVPDYFYRKDENGDYSNGSGCGNDVASERSMVKKFIVDSVLYWADEYHIDGFRFDLVGLIDVETINEIREEINNIDPSIILYGEGWSLDTKVTKDDVILTTQQNSNKVKEFAFFSDNLRDGIKGSVFEAKEKGYVNGDGTKKEEIMDGVLGLPSWAQNPSQVVNYSSCHDNLTLWDKIASSNPENSIEERIRQNNLAAAIVFTSQGIPFIHAGEEMLRTKQNENGTFNENSYDSSSSINSIKWQDLNQEKYQKVHDYYRGLIQFRNTHSALRMTDGQESKKNITFTQGLKDHVIAYSIKQSHDEIADELYVIYNPNSVQEEVPLPKGTWKVCINDEVAGVEVIEKVTEKVTVTPVSSMVLVRGKANQNDTDDEELLTVSSNHTENETELKPDKETNSKFNIRLVLSVVIIIAVIVLGFVAYKKTRV